MEIEKKCQPTYCDLLQKCFEKCVVCGQIVKDFGIMADIYQNRKCVSGYRLVFRRIALSVSIAFDPTATNYLQDSPSQAASGLELEQAAAA